MEQKGTMDWGRLITNKRFGKEEKYRENKEYRTDFQRDFDRLIFSAPFRRMQNKTQVFPLPGSIFVHNRLTHSLEVSSVGRSLGTDVARELQQLHPELLAQRLDYRADEQRTEQSLRHRPQCVYAVPFC